MYKIVDAVNQQIPKSVKTGPLLVLTKFAELVSPSKLPNSQDKKIVLRRRVSMERFMAMTHYADRKSLKDALDFLHNKKYLLCLEKREEKKNGDPATLYELCLPEGYDEQLVDDRRLKYYGGEIFCSKICDDDNMVENVRGESRAMPPVMVAEAGENPGKEGKNPGKEGKNPGKAGETHPYNKTITEEDNNRGEVVVSEEVKRAIDEAAVLTGAELSQFKDLALPEEQLPTFRDAMDIYRKQDRTGKYPNQNAAYLRQIFLGQLKQKPCGPIAANPNEPTPKMLSEQAINERWDELVAGLELGEMPSDELKALKDNFSSALSRHVDDKVPTFAQNFVKRLKRNNGKSFEELRKLHPQLADRVKLLKAAIEYERTR